MIVQEEQIYVIEVNTLPGLTSHSLIPKATKNLDFSFGEFLDKLINFELKKIICALTSKLSYLSLKPRK